jgi:hypothetical protein
MTTHPLSNIYDLMSQATAAAGQMPQEELDVLGKMLDRLEEVEIYLDTNLSRKERFDALVEFNTLTDRISAMIDRV